MGKKIIGFGHIESDAAIVRWLSERAKADTEQKHHRLSDGGGLFLLYSKIPGKDIQPAWRLEYKWQGKDKLLSLGTYARVKLASAREAADAANAQLNAGINPSAKRKEAKAEIKQALAVVKMDAELIADGKTPEGSFAHVAQLFHDKKVKAEEWGTDKHAPRFLAVCKKYWFPAIGHKRLPDIDVEEMRAVLEVVKEEGKKEQASKVLEFAIQVFNHGMHHKERYCKANTAASLKGMLDKVEVTHHPKIETAGRLGELLRAIDTDSSFIVRSAMLLQIMLMQRPINTAHMGWHEIDFEGATWRLGAKRMKQSQHKKRTGKTHVVPLPPQAIALLRKLHAITGHTPWVFTVKKDKNGKAKPITTQAMNDLLRRCGFPSEEACSHGMRGTAKSLMMQELDMAPMDAHLEWLLHHVYKGAHGSTYTDPHFGDHCMQIVCEWADALDAMREGRFVRVKAGTRVANAMSSNPAFAAAMAAAIAAAAAAVANAKASSAPAPAPLALAA